MRPIFGYSPKGQRIRYHATLNSRDRHSLVCGVSTEGVEGHYIVSGSVNKVLFLDFLKNTLPNCKQTTVILDNVPFHHSNEVLKVMNDCGKKVVFVPPYSPQYNPIEHVFSSMKTSFRRMQEEESELIPLSVDRLDDFVQAWKACEQPCWEKTFNHCLRKCLVKPLPDGTVLDDNSMI
jgi:transposase